MPPLARRPGAPPSRRGLAAAGLLIALLASGGCSQFGPAYRAADQGGVLAIGVAPSSLAFDVGLALALLSLGVFYNLIRKKITREHDLEFLTMGRILTVVMLTFVLAKLVYPHAVFEIRVDERGVSERTALGERLIPWEQMVAVRNNTWRELVTPDGIVRVPRLEIVGSHDDFIYVEKKEIGAEIYEKLASEVGQRYYGREKLINGPPGPPAEAAPPEPPPAGP